MKKKKKKRSKALQDVARKLKKKPYFPQRFDTSSRARVRANRVRFLTDSVVCCLYFVQLSIIDVARASSRLNSVPKGIARSYFAPGTYDSTTQQPTYTDVRSRWDQVMVSHPCFGLTFFSPNMVRTNWYVRIVFSERIGRYIQANSNLEFVILLNETNITFVYHIDFHYGRRFNCS